MLDVSERQLDAARLACVAFFGNLVVEILVRSATAAAAIRTKQLRGKQQKLARYLSCARVCVESHGDVYTNLQGRPTAPDAS